MFGLPFAIKLISWLAGGGIKGAADAITSVYTAKLKAGEDHDKLAAGLVAQQLQLDMQDAALQSQLSNTERWYTPRALMGYAVTFYVAKVLVWDKSLHLGVTDPVDERIWWIITTIIIAYFGARAVRDVTLLLRK